MVQKVAKVESAQTVERAQEAWWARVVEKVEKVERAVFPYRHCYCRLRHHFHSRLPLYHFLHLRYPSVLPAE